MQIEAKHTSVFLQTPIIFNKQVGQRAMYMGTYFLARLRRAEHSNYRDRWTILTLTRCCCASEQWIKVCRRGLVVIYAVQSKSKGIHEECGGRKDGVVMSGCDKDEVA